MTVRERLTAWYIDGTTPQFLVAAVCKVVVEVGVAWGIGIWLGSLNLLGVPVVEVAEAYGFRLVASGEGLFFVLSLQAVWDRYIPPDGLGD